ncbi:hypothetical protein MRB53_039696 [Persea americana]|nr:hypothetical protein MRB53_039696 [Persea americana]
MRQLYALKASRIQQTTTPLSRISSAKSMLEKASSTYPCDMERILTKSRRRRLLLKAQSRSSEALQYPAAASFKHVSPAGAAIGVRLSDVEKKVYNGGGISKAWRHQIIGKEVSDGVIAPGYQPEALEILSKKKGGKYLVLQIDPTYTPPTQEQKTVIGVTLTQHRNDANITPQKTFNTIVVPKDSAPLPESAREFIAPVLPAIKPTIGGCAFTSVHWTSKWKKGTKRADKSNAIDLLCSGIVPDSGIEREEWERNFEESSREIVYFDRASGLKARNLGSRCGAAPQWFEFLMLHPSVTTAHISPSQSANHKSSPRTRVASLEDSLTSAIFIGIAQARPSSQSPKRPFPSHT